jgi:hypothetical protein
MTPEYDDPFMAPPVAHAEVPRLRGGEAAEHYRYSLSREEIGQLRAQEQRIILHDMREIVEAIEADIPQVTRQVTRHPETLANMWSNTSWMLRRNFEHRNRFIPLRHSFSY